MTGIHISDFVECIVRPSLKAAGLHSDPAEKLLVGTACQESHLGRYLVQIDGPALGLYQMEPGTHDDIHVNFLKYHDDLRVHIFRTSGMPLYRNDEMPSPTNLIYNLRYATLMARAHYLRFKPPLPHEDDIEGQALYWKKFYNTDHGKGKPEEYLNNWERLAKLYYS